MGMPKMIFARYESAAASTVVTALVLVAVALGGCASSGQSQGGAQMSVDSLVQRMEAEDVNMLQQGGGVQDEFSSESSAEFRAGSSGDVVEVYEFRREATAELEANRIDADPNQPPFYYQDSNLIVVHRGQDQVVSSALLSIFGRRVR